MSTVELGIDAHLHVATTSAGAKTEVTGIGIGIDGLNRMISGSVTPAAGSGVLAGQLSDFDNFDFAVSTPSDAVLDPLWRASNGQRMWCTYADAGDDTGDELLTFEAVVQCSLAFTVHPDNVRWTVQFFVDGAPTSSVIP